MRTGVREFVFFFFLISTLSSSSYASDECSAHLVLPSEILSIVENQKALVAFKELQLRHLKSESLNARRELKDDVLDPKIDALDLNDAQKRTLRWLLQTPRSVKAFQQTSFFKRESYRAAYADVLSLYESENAPNRRSFLKRLNLGQTAGLFAVATVVYFVVRGLYLDDLGRSLTDIGDLNWQVDPQYSAGSRVYYNAGERMAREIDQLVRIFDYGSFGLLDLFLRHGKNLLPFQKRSTPIAWAYAWFLRDALNKMGRLELKEHRALIERRKAETPDPIHDELLDYIDGVLGESASDGKLER